MLATERRKRILELIGLNDSVTVSELSEMFGVADETVRRDLKLLEKNGVLQRNRGGASSNQFIRQVAPFYLRDKESKREKCAIAAFASELIKDGDSMILDSGTTALELARRIKEKQNLTVVTNSLHVAFELGGLDNINLIMCGGDMEKNSFALIGSDAQAFLRKFHVRYAFIALSGISRESGCTVSSLAQSSLKRVMMEASIEPIIIADHTKLGQNALVSFCTFDEIKRVITDSGADQEILAELVSCGVRVDIADIGR